MRFFSGVKNNYKKSEAAAIVQILLELQAKAGLFEMDPASSANTLVDTVWTKYPESFDGRYGQRPHKLSVAACSFANAIEVLGIENENAYNFAICLGKIMDEVDTKGNLYPFNSLDHQLLESAASTFMKFSDVFAASPLAKEISMIFDPK